MYLLTAMLGVASMTMVFTSCNNDECKDVVCENGGTCNSTDGSCGCPAGYEGSTCAILSRDKFIGTYSGTETCTDGNDTYGITISTNSDPVKFTISNLYNDNLIAIASADGNSFTIPSQTAAAGVTASGSGTITGNNITITYTISDGTLSNTCTYTGTK